MKGNFSNLIKSEALVLVDFYADWCGPCKVLTPILEEVKNELGNDVKIIKVDVDKNPKIAAKFRVQGIPTMLLFKNGDIVWRQSGLVQKNAIIQEIQSR